MRVVRLLAVSALTMLPVFETPPAHAVSPPAVDPLTIRQADLDGSKRGPLLGIPGAPAFLGRPLAAADTAWSLCDSDAHSSRRDRYRYALTCSHVVGRRGTAPLPRESVAHTLGRRAAPPKRLSTGRGSFAGPRFG